MRIFSTILVVLAVLVPSTSSAAADVPEFDPEAPVDLDKWEGSEWPSEDRVMEAFEAQYPRFDACVEAEKRRTKKDARLEGDAGMSILLNPVGRRPLGVNAAVEEPIQKRRELVRCLRRATASGDYPSYDGPPLVVEFEFEMDPGYDVVEED